MDNLDKLNNLNVYDYLTDEEKIQMAEVLDQIGGMKDWAFDSTDNSMKLKIAMVNNSNNPDPMYQKIGDSGFDFMASLPEGAIIIAEPLKRVLIPTGLHFQIPIGFELQVRPRSGLALKNGITVLNTPGTVDSGYRGEIKVILYNTGDESFTIKNGDRIAQGVITPVQNKKTTIFTRVESLDDSDRGVDGFGSTGV